MQIFAFGDSITYGSWDAQGGWADRLKRYSYEYIEADPQKWIEVYNLGILGDRTDHLLKRFMVETEQRLDVNDTSVFLFAFGANDAAFIPDNNDFKISPDEFVANLHAVIQQAKLFSSTIALLTITPVNESVTSRAAEEKVRKNEYIERYNQNIKRLAREENIEVIDVYDVFINSDPNTLLDEDGLHPNTQGHEIIFEQVRDYLINKF